MQTEYPGGLVESNRSSAMMSLPWGQNVVKGMYFCLRDARGVLATWPLYGPCRGVEVLGIEMSRCSPLW